MLKRKEKNKKERKRGKRKENGFFVVLRYNMWQVFIAKPIVIW